MESKSLNESIINIRVKLQNAKLKKSGKNKFAGFDYFELGDFLPQATDLFLKYGLTPIFRIESDELGVEYAYLTIIRGNEQVTFKVPTANPRPDKTPNPIQELGSKITYMRRYLYLLCLDIIENDVVDATIGMDKTEEKATPGQISELIANASSITDELKKRGIKDGNMLKRISKREANELLEILHAKG